jgi:hypothetical protein
MANGHGGKRPGAGRPKGARDKLNNALRERFEVEGIDPAWVLAEIMQNSDDEKLRRAAASDLMPYLHPRLASQDLNISGELGTPELRVIVTKGDGSSSPS